MASCKTDLLPPMTGHEDTVMLFVDDLINFSRTFLPETRSGSMDAPLVLTTRLDPKEVDKESLNVDVMERYPLELYEAALRYAPPKELEKAIDHVDLRVGTPGQYEGFWFTHDTADISRRRAPIHLYDAGFDVRTYDSRTGTRTSS